MKLDTRSLYKLVVYMRRGYAIYINFPITVINFIVITYTLAVSKIEPLDRIFMDNPYLYAIAIAMVIAPIATILGWLDYKKMTFPREIEANPYFTKPTYKERYIYIPLWLTLLEQIGKLLELNGLETHEIIELKRKIIEWSKKQV